MSTPRIYQMTVGIVGGGQLGRMLAEACKPLGVRTHVLDPSPTCPCAGVADKLIQGSITDASAIARLAESGVDVVTVEIEHVNAAALATLSVPVHPHPSTLALIADKYAQKRAFQRCGVAVGALLPVATVADGVAAGKALGYPFMLKSRGQAYDGRGNAVVKDEASVEAAVTALIARASESARAAATVSASYTLPDGSTLTCEPGLLYAEAWVDFTRELSVLVVRSTTGETAVYPAVHTVQRHSMCHSVMAPAPTSPAVSAAAVALARAAVQVCAGAGVFAVEQFELSDGRLLLNEVAPRVHNSGHWTSAACTSSQFESHIRAVTGMPLGDVGMTCRAAGMVNIVGAAEGEEGETAAWAVAAAALRTKRARLHWYCKSVRVGRKLGHVNVTGDSAAEVAHTLAAVTGEAVEETAPRPLVGVIMGSDSDLPSMKAACTTLVDFNVPFEVSIVSAHRTPGRLMDYASSARGRGLQVIIAAAGGAAHLPGMVAAMTPLPVVGVPIPLAHCDGMDSLLSIVQMPRGVPVATVAIGNAVNGALLAIRILGSADPAVGDAMAAYQKRMEGEVMDKVHTLEERGWRAYGAPAPAPAEPHK